MHFPTYGLLEILVSHSLVYSNGVRNIHDLQQEEVLSMSLKGASFDL